MAFRPFPMPMRPGPLRFFAGLLLLSFLSGWRAGRSLPMAVEQDSDYLRRVYSPLHFQSAIATATDGQCLTCHRSVLEETVRANAPAGIPSAKASAWYQALSTYQGAQETFHRRHLLTPLAKTVMRLSCNTCHQGHDPREQAPGSSATAAGQVDAAFSLRRNVDAETVCLKCHGQLDWKIMGLRGPWPEAGKTFKNGCLTCHATIRTVRHRVSYLRTDAIEVAAQENSDTCFGCHGGRAWYRLSYSYPRHPWPGMACTTPDWARSRPAESEPRFLTTEVKP